MDDLETYKAQLEQVQAALTTDPDNEDLLKLQKDLEEVINLTLELATPAPSSSSGYTSAFGDEAEDPTSDSPPQPSSSSFSSAQVEEESISASFATASSSSSSSAPQSVFASVKSKHLRAWKSGDRCMAPWNDGRYHPAKVDEVIDESVCSVVFEGYGQTEVAVLTKLLPYVVADDAGEPGAKRAMSKKDLMEREKERKKKKKARWMDKVKEIEESREKEKNKWQSFSNKAISKSKKGTIKKSIFATPDDGRGRVGFGTCGMGGKDMTKNEKVAHWKPSLEQANKRK